MRKGTKKNIIHGILIIIVIIFALMASLIAAFRDITVQSMIARSIAGELSRKLETDVKIRTFYITENMTVRMEDVVFNDLDGYPMFRIGTLDAKFYPILMPDDIKIKEIYMKDVLGRIVKYEENEKINITEIIAQFRSGEQKETDDDESSFRLCIDKFKLDNGHVIYWNQHKHKPEKLSMDWAHIDIDSIYGDITNLGIRGDTVFGNVHSLKGKDRCGLVLDYARGNVVFCEKSLNIDSLILETGESRADLDLRFDYNRSSAYYEFVDSVDITGNIRKSVLLLSDLKYFSWILERLPDKFTFTGQHRGPVSDFTVSDFVADFGNESYIDADISFKGLPEFFDSFMDIEIREMYSSYEDTKNFAIPIESKTVPIPEMLEGLGRYSLKGSYQGLATDFRTQFQLKSEMGDIDATVYLNTTDESIYSFDISANALQLDGLLGSNDGSEASFDFVLNGEGLDVENTEFEAALLLNSLKIKGNTFEDVLVHGLFENQRFSFNTDIAHPNLDVTLNSAIDLNDQLPAYFIKANIGNIDLVNLNLIDNDSIMRISTDIDAIVKGNDIDNITGYLDIKNTRFFNGENYLMKDFHADVSEISGLKEVNINCDFFKFYGYGIVCAKSLVNSVKNTAKSYVDIPDWFADVKPDVNDQNFSFNIDFYDTRMLSKLFMPSLYVRSGTTVHQAYNNLYTSHTTTTINSPEIWFNGISFRDVRVQNNAEEKEMNTELTVKDIVFRDSTERNPDRINIDNFKLLTRFGDDMVTTNLYWDDIDETDHNKAHIKSVFIPYESHGGKMNISSEMVLINDTMWYLNPNCSIEFKKNNTVFDEVVLYTRSQSLSVNGVFPVRDIDTLKVEFRDFDVSDLDFITLGSNLDFDGYLNGFVGFSGMSENASFSSNIKLNDFYINGQEVGNVNAFANWYEPNESVMLDMEMYNRHFNNEGHKSAGLFGFYYPSKKTDNLTLDVFFNDFKLETVSPFVVDVVSRMNGFASGNLKVRGSVKDPVLVGDIEMKNAGCCVNFLNTYYTLDNKITLDDGKIIFNDIAIKDTLGNTATLGGVINHEHLRDFNFDLSLKCNDFLAMNIPAEKANGFYGTAVADGVVQIKGPVNDITMNINALTKKGTEIDVPLSGTSSFDDSFVVFVQKNQATDTVIETYIPEIVKDKSSFTMNLSTTVTQDAAVNIFLPQNMGSINARGVGNLNIGLNPDAFELRGEYVIRNGNFVFTLDMVKKTFTLREGGTIRWTGDPTDADINIVGVYHTKSSLNSLGTLAVDSSALTNNINVDCIIRLSDKLMNPSINFGIELPNAKEDTRNIVFSVIDTTNQAVMAQQVFSLMMLGSFSYTAGSNIARFGTNAGYGVITSQLSNLLSQIYKDVDVGINYTPNDQLTNEELEVALSTQLFDDRLTIEGNFGVIRGNRRDADNANNIVGDVDLTFRLTKRLSLKAYNHTNIKNNYYYYSVENYSDFTQGVGISLSQSFDKLKEVFTIHKKNKKKDTTNEPNPK